MHLCVASTIWREKKWAWCTHTNTADTAIANKNSEYDARAFAHAVFLLNTIIIMFINSTDSRLMWPGQPQTTHNQPIIIFFSCTKRKTNAIIAPCLGNVVYLMDWTTHLRCKCSIFHKTQPKQILLINLMYWRSRSKIILNRMQCTEWVVYHSFETYELRYILPHFRSFGEFVLAFAFPFIHNISIMYCTIANTFSPTRATADCYRDHVLTIHCIIIILTVMTMLSLLDRVTHVRVERRWNNSIWRKKNAVKFNFKNRLQNDKKNIWNIAVACFFHFNIHLSSLQSLLLRQCVGWRWWFECIRHQ